MKRVITLMLLAIVLLLLSVWKSYTDYNAFYSSGEWYKCDYLFYYYGYYPY